MMDKIERIARIIVESSIGAPADTLVVYGEPTKVPGFPAYYAPPADRAKPMWQYFIGAAHQLLQAGFDCPDEENVGPIEEKAVDEDLGPFPSQNEEWRERLGLA